MKRFRNFILVLLSIVSCICFTIGLSACIDDNNTENTQNKDILAVYNMYVAYAAETSTTPLSYSDWLLTIKGEQGPAGKDGTNGKDGLGIKNVAINNDGDLIVTFDDNTTLNAGNVANKSNRLNENNKIAFKTLKVTENTAYGKVSNATETFSFIDEIDLVGNAGYTVYADLQGTKVVPTKTVALEIGDNTFYILETCANDSNLYTVTIRRRPIYTVTFMDFENASLPMAQQVEEDSFAVRPDIDGLFGWDPDSAFTTPITNHTTFELTKKLIFDEQRWIMDHELALTEFGGTLSYINITEWIIEQTYYSITSKAFYYCRNLKNVTLCEQLSAIKEMAFMGCTNLQSITLPTTNLKSIEKSAFEECDSLTTVKIPSNVKTIDQWAFRSCDNLTSVTMENGVEQLGEEVFKGCVKLQSVTIPASVTQMGNLLFKDCTELSTITYSGTKAQWNSLVENLTLYNGSKTITVNCTDGTVQLQGAQA